jgi:uncharacterized membrane-anchored protein
LGDLLSQPVEYGGLGLGTVATSWVFLGIIGAVILYMSFQTVGQEGRQGAD